MTKLICKATGKDLHLVDVTMQFDHGGMTCYPGERVALTDEDVAHVVGAGWANDATGELPTGTPDLSHKTLKVDKAQHVPKTTDL